MPKLDRLLRGSSFDAATEQAIFRIAATDNAAVVPAPLLCRNVLPEAKKVRIDFLPWHTGVYDQLAHGRIDLAMAASIVDVPPHLFPRYVRQTLGHCWSFCQSQQNNPLAQMLTDHLSLKSAPKDVRLRLR
jgi:hypothetical protein